VVCALPGERVHPLGQWLAFERTALHRPGLPELDQPFVHGVMAAVLLPLHVQVQLPVIGVHRQPRYRRGRRETGVGGGVPLVRRSGRVPAQAREIVGPRVQPPRVNCLVPADGRVRHADLLAHVRERGPGQQHVQHVHGVHHFAAKPRGRARLVVVSDLENNK